MTAVLPDTAGSDPGPPVPQAPADGAGVARHSALLSASAGIVGVLSYACTLVMAHALSAAEYSQYAAGQMLVGIVGIVSSALVPLPLANVVRGNSPGSPGRLDGVAFSLLVSAATGALAAIVVGGVTALFAPLPVVAAVGASALALFAISPAWGWMQGELRFVRYAAFTVAEVAVRLAFSVAAIAAGWGAAGALGGFVAGALVVVLAAVAAIRTDVSWRPRVLAERWRWAETGDIALTQLVVSTLVGADVVLVSVLGGASTTDAGYQALATLTKGPVYVAAGTVLVAFPLLRSTAARVDDILRAALRSFVHLAFPTAAVLATLPAGVALWVLPARYADALLLLPWLALAGLGYAVMTVLATVMLALRAYRRSQLGLLVAVAVLPTGLLVGWSIGQIGGLAVGGAVGALGATAVLGAIASPLLPRGTLRLAVAAVVGASALLGLLRLVQGIPLLWLAVTAVSGVLVIMSLQGRLAVGRSGTTLGEDATAPLHLLHVGSDHPAMPDSCPTARRDHEINRRIAEQAEVTALVRRFPGCSDGVIDGVRYRHVGVGRSVSRAGYRLALPFVARGFRGDVLTEGARGTARFARLLDRRGAVTLDDEAGIGQRLVEVDPAAFGVPARPGEHVLFLGDLDIRAEGLDLLLRAWAVACRDIPGQLILVGDGPDRDAIRELAASLSLGGRVDVFGPVPDEERFDLLAGARVVAVPAGESRPRAIAEALATGTPVVALRVAYHPELPAGCGSLVAPEDSTAFGLALVAAQFRDRLNPRAAREFAAGHGRVAAHRLLLAETVAGRAVVPTSIACTAVAGAGPAPAAPRQDAPTAEEVRAIVEAPSTPEEPPPAPARQWVAVVGARLRAVPAWVLAVLVGLASFGVGAVGLRTANDVFIDEITYGELAEQLSRGVWPNQFGVPFFLHPIASFLLNGGVVKLFGITGSDMDVALQLRWVNVVLGAVLVAAAFLLVRRLTTTGVALVAAVVLAFDPFVLRSDTRLMLETPATAPVIAGWLVLLVGLTRRPGIRSWSFDAAAGLLLGLGLVTKDLAFVLTVLPLVLAVVWRQTLPWKRVARVLAASAVPYTAYLIVITTQGLMPQWWAAKFFGVRRLLGLDQVTGFNAEGPGIVSRLLEKMVMFGTSYVLVGIGLFAGVLAAFSTRPERRLVGLVAAGAGALGMYAFVAGAAEEQIGYYTAVTAVIALAVCAAELRERLPRLKPWIVGLAALFTLITIFLGATARLTVDDGYLRARAWMEASIPVTSPVGLTTVTGEFGLLPHPGYGVWPSITSLATNQAQYVFTESNPIEQGYGYAAPPLLDWLGANADPAFDFYGPSKGHTTVWRIRPGALAAAVAQHVDFKPVAGGYR